MLGGNVRGSLQVLLLPLVEIGRQLAVDEQDIVFIVKVETASVHIGGAYQRNLAVYGQ